MTAEYQPIAIVGLACRFPGDGESPQEFYEMLKASRSAWSEVPKDRFTADSFYHPDYDRQGANVTKGAHFMKQDISKFDAPFFSITAGEATAMDPQSRLLLEVSYECLENAGASMESVVGSDAACFIGCFTRDYSELSTMDMDNGPTYAATGQGLSMLSNRVRCQAINNGEASSAIIGGTGAIILPDGMNALSTLHFLSPDGKCFSFDERANGYARGEGISAVMIKSLDLAIRDGDNIRAVIRGTGTNQDGRTPGITLPSTDAQADLIRQVYANAGLNYLDTAYFEAHGTGTAQGDPIELRAIGTTFGQESKGSVDRHPLYVGSVKSNIGHLEGAAGMAGLIKSILSIESGVILPSINFDSPNPAILFDDWNIRIPTEAIPWPNQKTRRVSINGFGYGGTNAHVIIEDAYHYLKDRHLRGHHSTVRQVTMTSINDSSSDSLSVDSGIGKSPACGTPPSSVKADGGVETSQENGNTPHIFVFSAPEREAVNRLAKSHCKYVSNKLALKDTAQILERLSYTLAARRSKFVYRQAVVASTALELAHTLKDEFPPAIRSGKSGDILFVFTGQGAQWASMGQELLTYPVFSASIHAADAFFKSIGAAWSVMEELYADEQSTRINCAEFSQPLCTVVQVALVDLLDLLGVRPKAVAGHSSGEIAAAYCAGYISAVDAWAIAYHRGRLSGMIKSLNPERQGGMMAVGLPESSVQEYLTRLQKPESVVVACMNSPTSITLSGDLESLKQLKTMFDTASVFARTLKVENAYHSHHMQVIGEDYRASIGHVQPLTGSSGVMMVSTVRGDLITSNEVGADYWVENMLSPVKFAHALNRIIPTLDKSRRRLRAKEANIGTIIELGPHSALQGPIKQILAANSRVETTSYSPTILRNQSGLKTLLSLIGKLWCTGALANVHKVLSVDSKNMRLLSDLPAYPWNHLNSYWHESYFAKTHRFQKTPRLDLIGRPVRDFNLHEPRWRNVLKLNEQPWLADHQVQGSIIFPGAGYICMAIEAAQQIKEENRQLRTFEFRDVTFGEALSLAQDGSRVVDIYTHFKKRRLGFRATAADWIEWSVYSMSDNETFVEHCSGLLMLHYHQAQNEVEDVDELSLEWEAVREEYQLRAETCNTTVPAEQIYNMLASVGNKYGPLFQGIVEGRSGDSIGYATVKIPDTKSAMPCQFEYPHHVHPATLDSILQSLFLASMKNEKLHAAVPSLIESIRISADLPHGAGATLKGFSKTYARGFRTFKGSMYFSDESFTSPKIIVQGLECTDIGLLTGDKANEEQLSMMKKIASTLVWKEDFDSLTSDDWKKLYRKTVEDHYQSSLEDVCERELGTEFSYKGEKLSAIFTKRALQWLKPETEAGFNEHLRRYVAWMRDQHDLASKGLLPLQDNTDAWLQLSREEEDQFIQETKDTHADFRLVCKIGTQLPAILSGEVQGISLLMEDDFLFKYYLEAAGMALTSRALTCIADLMTHKRPDLKVIEVGAGSGSGAVHFLQPVGGRHGATARLEKYCFTDISSGFFDNAQELLKDWTGHVEYRRLDLEQDPGDQGFEDQAYDLVIAHNVLHGTRNIDRTLMHVAKLLKPGGGVLMSELTRPLNRLRLAFGALPGWWLSEDGRKGGPTMTEAQWGESLKRAGFSGLDWRFSEAIIVKANRDDSRCKALDHFITEQLIALGLKVQTLTTRDIGSAPDEGQASMLGKKLVISLLEVPDSWMLRLDEEKFSCLKKMVLRSGGLLWVTRGDSLSQNLDPNRRIISGLLRSVRHETSGLFTEFDISHDTPLSSPSTENALHHVLLGLLRSDPDFLETEAAERAGRVMIPRLYDNKSMNRSLLALTRPLDPEPQPLFQKDRPLRLSIGAPGLLGTLHFVDDESSASPLGEDELQVNVEANSLNFVYVWLWTSILTLLTDFPRDIMIAMGLVPGTSFGVDAAGTVAAVGSQVQDFVPGDRVAVLMKGACRTHVRCNATLAQKIPDSMSFEDAAAMTTVYVTAYRCIYDVARLTREDSILIHAAAGGLGQACIQMAQHIGATIFVTVGSQAKRDLMLELGIPKEHIFSSRSLGFAKGILRVTNGRGVDVAINSLAGEALRKTWSIMAPFGRFVEVGKKDILGNTGLEMMPFLQNITFAGVNLEHVFNADPAATQRLMCDTFNLIKSGVVEPPKPVTAYSYGEIEKAFRVMQQGKHIGKVVLKANINDVVPVVPSDAHPLQLRSSATYLLVGGLGGLGRAQAEWLAKNGANHIAFISRSGAGQPEGQKAIEHLQQMGVNVRVYACDIGDKSHLAECVEDMRHTMPPLRGVMHGGMILSDATFERMQFSQWATTERPKITGTWNLHDVLPKDLDFFILLSSGIGVQGGRGQSNYSACGSFQDAFAHYRQAQGLKANTLDIGIMEHIGFVKENRKRMEDLKSVIMQLNTIAIAPAEFLECLKACITGYSFGDEPTPTQIIMGSGTGGLLAHDVAQGRSADNYYWFSNIQFSYLRRLDAHGNAAQEADDGAQEARTALANATTLMSATEAVLQAMLKKLAKSMLMAVDDIDSNKPVSHYGVDSLLAIEVRNWIVRELGSDVSVFDILKAVPITGLAERIASVSKFLPKELKGQVALNTENVEKTNDEEEAGKGED
ncbi:MAG: hypothetical protein Q9159_007665 [Coniocarpon cinnabarinum]